MTPYGKHEEFTHGNSDTRKRRSVPRNDMPGASVSVHDTYNRQKKGESGEPEKGPRFSVEKGEGVTLIDGKKKGQAVTCPNRVPRSRSNYDANRLSHPPR